MYYLLVVLASLMLSGRAHAVPVEFTVDLAFRSREDTVPSQSGFLANAGFIHFDSELLAPTGTSLVPFSRLSSFQLAVPTFFFIPGPTQFDLDDVQAQFVSCRVEIPGEEACGLVFAGGSFQGFQGFFVTLPNQDGRELGLGSIGGVSPQIATRAPFLRTEASGTVTLRSAAPVPEPSSWAMIGVCGLLAGWAYRRKA